MGIDADSSLTEDGHAIGLARLVEREAELRSMKALLGEVAAGSGRALIIRGPAGIGKTSLTRQLAEMAKSAGFTSLSASASEFERDFSFGCVRQLFERLVHGDDAVDIKEAFSGDARPAQAVFGATTDSSYPTSGFDTLHGLYWMTAELAARSPVLLTLDDAQWADDPSLRFLDFLRQRLAGIPVLVTWTIRSGEPPDSAGHLRSLQSDLAADLIEPSPLSVAGVASLVRDALCDPGDQLLQQCHRASGGNPFLLKALLHEVGRLEPSDVTPDLIEGLGSGRVADAALSRVERAGPGAIELTHAVAVLGDGATLRCAAALAALPEGRASEAADSLAAAAILDPGRPLRFVHPIVRSAVYQRMGVSERSRLHLRAVGLLGETDHSVEALALHLLAAEPGATTDGVDVVDVLSRSADIAAARGYHEAAVRYLERALEEGPTGDARSEILFGLGRNAWLVPDPRAADWLRDALQSTSSARLATEAALCLVQVLAFAGGRLDEVLGIIERLRGEGLIDPDLGEWLDATVLGLGHIAPTARRAFADGIERNLAAARAGEGLTTEFLANAAIECALADGTVEEAMALSERALAARVDEEIRGDELWPPFVMATQIVCERFEAAERLADELLRGARERGAHRYFAAAIGLRAWARYRQGRLVEVRADAELYEGFADTALSDWQLTGAHVQALLDTGMLERATSAAAVILAAPEPPLLTIYQRFAEALAPLRLALGDPGGALQATRGIAAWENGLNQRNGTWVDWRSQAALAHAELGDHDEARRLAAEQVDLARSFGATGMLGSALRSFGLVTGGDDGIDALRQGVETLRGSALRLEHARATVDLGVTLRARGYVAEAREQLRTGHDLARSLGAGGIAERAVSELVASGARPRLTGSGSGRLAEALTPTEHRVASLVATGLSNKEAAKELFVTVNTIETHLRSTYRKLGIASRAQLPGRLV